MKEYRIDSNSIAKYQSSTVIRNGDGTFRVEHIFIDDKEKQIIVNFPRVNISIDYINSTKVFPFYNVEVLPSDKKELFNMTIK